MEGNNMLAHVASTQFASLLLQAQQSAGELSADQKTQIALEALRRPGGSANGVLALLVPFAFFAAVVLIIWLLLRQRQARNQVRVEFHKQLLDKFSSGREFADFLESKGSQRFLEELWSQKMGPKEQILRSMRNGIVLAVFGLGMLVVSWKAKGLVIPGVLILALGVGFLISTAISHRLSKKWEQESGSEHARAS
jgi:hypothetical protein